MPRPSKADERRRELLPLIAEAFSELGYRRATTAEIAQRCDVQENTLYRLWADKKAMFIAAIDFLFVRRMSKWQSQLDASDMTGPARAKRLIEQTGAELGEQGLYRIIFAALSETDDADVKEALRHLYKSYLRRVKSEVCTFRDGKEAAGGLDDDAVAWALIGMVAFMNIVIDLDLVSARKRRELFTAISNQLLGDAP